MEVGLARNGGLGWRGKHTLLLDRDAGSYFFLGELFTDLPLAADTPVTDHCGTCTACMDACPTRAIVAPYRLDARLCISYLTIELKSELPEPLRTLLGNRIYGCDDCQLACPWNGFAPLSREADFAPRQGLDQATLAELFAWEECDFEERLAGSPIRRIGHERWLRNIAVALGNAPRSEAVLSALRSRAGHPSALVREHVAWALRHHGESG
jgi:epoxyqueuosine reductase